MKPFHSCVILCSSLSTTWRQIISICWPHINYALSQFLHSTNDPFVKASFEHGLFCICFADLDIKLYKSKIKSIIQRAYHTLFLKFSSLWYSLLPKSIYVQYEMYLWNLAVKYDTIWFPRSWRLGKMIGSYINSTPMKISTTPRWSLQIYLATRKQIFSAGCAYLCKKRILHCVQCNCTVCVWKGVRGHVKLQRIE